MIRSFIATKILNPYWWSVIVEYVPRSIAPNLITLTGFLCVIANVLLLLHYSPDLLSPLPSWTYISFAVGLFTYQSLDAIDGKQARRTGTSSPLGELFDHGCDALNTGFATFIGVRALGMGQTWWQIFTVYSCMGNFYLSTWEEYYTGVLFLSECSGPIEGVFMIIFILFVSAFWGPEVWSTPMKNLLPPALAWEILNIPLNIAFVGFGCVVIIFNVYTSYGNVLTAIQNTPASAEKAQKHPPLSGLIPFITLVTTTSLFPMLYPQTIVHSPSIVPFVIFLTFIFGHQVGSIIVAHISKRGFPMIEMMAPGLLLSAIAFGLQNLNAWWGLAALAGGLYLFWFSRIVVDLCEIFDIYCLTIKKKQYSQLPQ
ncbi:CDP-alcohol phosphatidyltransferase-domain-containing protein [Obelidium mucronatum]|nr:CDP-alcohol phosphatidyltransferase-domain-containing protein [Obelidium mucronatum]